MIRVIRSDPTAALNLVLSELCESASCWWSIPPDPHHLLQQAYCRPSDTTREWTHPARVLTWILWAVAALQQAYQALKTPGNVFKYLSELERYRNTFLMMASELSFFFSLYSFNLRSTLEDVSWSNVLLRSR